MKELNPLQAQYIKNCELLQSLNMPTDLFDELYKIQLYEYKIQLHKELVSEIKQSLI
jgi:hypothetical protein